MRKQVLALSFAAALGLLAACTTAPTPTAVPPTPTPVQVPAPTPTALPPTATPLPPPSPTHNPPQVYVIEGRDFAFAASPSIPAGVTTVTLRNTGAQEHEALLARLDEGKTLQDIVQLLSKGPPLGSAGVGACSPEPRGHRAWRHRQRDLEP